MKPQKEDSRIAQIKCLLDAIECLGYPSDIMKAVAVVLTLRGKASLRTRGWLLPFAFWTYKNFAEPS